MDKPNLLAPETSLVDPTQTGEASQPESIEVGQWYWVTEENDKRWFGCVVRLGSNYAKVENPRHGSTRIHFDDFHKVCTFEPNPDKVIDDRIRGYQQEVGVLLGRVKEVTASLAIAPGPALNGGNETQALALRSQDQPDMKEYGKALTKAKTETLPGLFQEIKDANEAMAVWMTAKVVPLKAQAAGLHSLINRIDDRIFSVELYAGLAEGVERIRDGEPAPLTEKIRLLQRRCYMDEECLARYETGGMEFKDIRDFDAWLIREENLERLLPFPRCVVAFRVRRNEKVREFVNLIQFFRMQEERKTDKYTYLYIRNGEQVFRMDTAIEFGSKLFPDLERAQLSGKLWAEEFGGRIDKLITDNEHTGILEERARRKKECEVKLKEWKVKNKAYQEALKSPKAKAAAKAKGKKQPDASCVDVPYPGPEPWFDRDRDNYVPYDRSHVLYDDITKKIEDDIRDHNRIALILQGLLDRSPVLHPHPPWQIWTPEGFATALDLIYDESRALVAGDKPDFEAYRAMLNASLQVGSVTVGQDARWAKAEAEKERDRRSRDRRHHGEHYYGTSYRPYGNPGPGMLAKLVSYSKQSGKCSYAWYRKRQTPPYDEKLRTSFACGRKHILNVDAYTPGDFRTFFDDPRTRTEYLEWAPLLLEAEEYHAGNRKVEEPPPPLPKKGSSWEGRERYRRIKRQKAYLDKAVRLTEEITTKGGHVYKTGTLWRVVAAERGTFTISGINPDGTFENVDKNWDKRRYVRNVSHYDLTIDLTIPNPTAKPQTAPKTKPVEEEEPEDDNSEEPEKESAEPEEPESIDDDESDEDGDSSGSFEDDD